MWALSLRRRLSAASSLPCFLKSRPRSTSLSPFLSRSHLNPHTCTHTFTATRFDEQSFVAYHHSTQPSCTTHPVRLMKSSLVNLGVAAVAV